MMQFSSHFVRQNKRTIFIHTKKWKTIMKEHIYSVDPHQCVTGLFRFFGNKIVLYVAMKQMYEANM